MKLNKLFLASNDKDYYDSVIDLLIAHFNYSLKDINSYEELTAEEKAFIPKELFEELTIECDSVKGVNLQILDILKTEILNNPNTNFQHLLAELDISSAYEDLSCEESITTLKYLKDAISRN